MEFDIFLTVHHSIELFHQSTLMHSFLYSLTICLLHYYPRYISSINMPIFWRKNCIHTASGIFALCKRLPSTLVDSGLQSALNQCTVQTFTESEDTRCCVNTIFPPEDGHVNARNMSRIIVLMLLLLLMLLLMNKENCALKLVDEIILYYDARSKILQM